MELQSKFFTVFTASTWLDLVPKVIEALILIIMAAETFNEEANKIQK